MDYQPLHVSQAQIKQLREDGFLIMENFLPADFAQRLESRMEPLFYGEFETGLLPDEWHWRPGMSLPNITIFTGATSVWTILKWTRASFRFSGKKTAIAALT